MEENPRELDSISSHFFINSIHFLHDSISILSSLSSHPLFSTIVALYTLILLYTPTFFFQIVLSPVFNSTGILFFLLLRLGANERRRNESDSPESRILDSDNEHHTHLKHGFGSESRILDSDDEHHTHLEHGFGPESRILDSDNEHHTHLKHGCDSESRILDSEHGCDSESRITGSLDENHKWALPESVQEQEVLDSADDEYRKWALPEQTKSTESTEDATEDHKWVCTGSNSKPTDAKESGLDSGSIRFYSDPFLTWNMRAPLEIIYEAYEGDEDEEEEEEEDESKENDGVSREKKPAVGLERYPSLSMCFPESDSDSSSDGEYPVTGKWDSPERMFFKWEEEERDELIEISINHEKRSERHFHDEEDNLIEIDISPRRNGDFPGDIS